MLNAARFRQDAAYVELLDQWGTKNHGRNRLRDPHRNRPCQWQNIKGFLWRTFLDFLKKQGEGCKTYTKAKAAIENWNQLCSAVVIQLAERNAQLEEQVAEVSAQNLELNARIMWSSIIHRPFDPDRIPDFLRQKYADRADPSATTTGSRAGSSSITHNLARGGDSGNYCSSRGLGLVVRAIIANH